MYTGNTLDLAEFDREFGLSVQRCCKFSYVGKVPTKLDRRVVPCTKQIHIDQALAGEGVAGIITLAGLSDGVPKGFGLAVSEAPLRSALLLQSHIAALGDFQWEHFETRIHPTAQVHEGAIVSPHDVVVGELRMDRLGVVQVDLQLLEELDRQLPGLFQYLSTEPKPPT